jgi:hypothetical protein
MDTDPKVAGDYLQITSISNGVGEVALAFTPASLRRYYTLRRRDDLAAGNWSNIIGQIDVPGAVYK